jgi:hypothetical protein
MYRLVFLDKSGPIVFPDDPCDEVCTLGSHEKPKNTITVRGGRATIIPRSTLAARGNSDNLVGFLRALPLCGMGATVVRSMPHTVPAARAHSPLPSSSIEKN